MFTYYTAIILLIWMALVVLCILIGENNRIPREEKKIFYLTYALIGLSALAEWLGVNMEGHTEYPPIVLRLVKCADYTLTPMAGGALLLQIRRHGFRRTILLAILAMNTVFQLMAAFSGWMVIVDERNNYTHGPFYPIYIGVYILVILLVIIEYVIYGSTFRRKNLASFYSIIMMVVIGICLQELGGPGIRTAYISMTMGVALMFIHYSEFSQLTADDHIADQHFQIMTDLLTGLGSFFAYTEALNLYRTAGHLPEHFTAMTIDINGLKRINDVFGHDAGNEVIRGAADCIREVLGSRGKCFRTGGDEFVALASLEREEAEEVVKNLEKKAAEFKGLSGGQLSLSAGYALAVDNPGYSAEQLVRKSDMNMYEAKAEYYSKNGRERRRSRQPRQEQTSGKDTGADS